jgi:AraC-like DNA-binding protein
MKIEIEMKMMKPLHLLFILSAGLLRLTAAGAQQYYPADRDSLRQLIAVSEGKEKLDAYKYLAVAYFFESKDELKMDTMLAVYEQMDAEAQRQGDYKVCGLIRHNILAAFHNAKNFDEIFRRTPAYLDFLEKKQVWTHYFNVYRALVKACIRSYRFDRALAESQAMYDKARGLNFEDGIAGALFCMSDVYEAQGRNEDAEHCLRQSILLMTGKTAFYSILPEAYYDLCQILLSMERYDETLLELREFEKANQLYEESARQEIPTTRANLYGCYARLYNSTGDIAQAEYYTNKLDSVAQTRVYRIMVCYNRAKIFRARKQYDLALEMIDQTIQLETPSSGKPTHMILKAAILADMGRAQESFAQAHAAILLSDTLRQMEYNRQLDGIRTQYEVDRHIAEKARTRNLLSFALAGCALLAVALGTWIYYSRKIQKKNRTLARQIHELTTQQELREAELLSKTSFVADDNPAAPTTDDGLCPESRMDKLCNAIRDLILKDKAYRNPALTRDLLIDQLGTNRELFIEAFAYCFGMSFPEYINSLRLKDAVTLLQQSDLSIEAISEKTGFGTLRTFQRQFLRKYNLSPKDFRKAAKNN